MTDKWLNEYSGLVKHKKDKLYCITGPFILGIELIKLPRINKYRPHLVIYSLYGLPLGNTLKDCMSYPVLMFEFFNSKNLQYSLDINEEIDEVKDSLNNFLPFEIGKNILAESFFNWLNSILSDSNLKSRIRLPEVWEVRYYLALYISSNKANLILNEIEKNTKNLDKEKCFKNYGGFSNWLNELKTTDRVKFLKLIDKNKNSKELKNLHCFEISSTKSN